MIIRAEILGKLRKQTGLHDIQVDLPRNAQVSDLLAAIEKQAPSLAAHREQIQATANFDFVSHAHQISESETISLFLPEDESPG